MPESRKYPLFDQSLTGRLLVFVGWGSGTITIVFNRAVNPKPLLMALDFDDVDPTCIKVRCATPVAPQLAFMSRTSYRGREQADHETSCRQKSGRMEPFCREASHSDL